MFTEWTVRDVVNHLVGMDLVFVAMFEESPMPARGADRLGADPAGAYRRSAAALQAAAARPGVLERSQRPAGGRCHRRRAAAVAHRGPARAPVGSRPSHRRCGRAARRSRRAGAHVRPSPAAQPAARRTIRRSAADPRQRARHRPAGGIHRPTSSVDAMNATRSSGPGLGGVPGGLLHHHPHDHADRARPVFTRVLAVVLPRQLGIDPPGRHLA